MTEILESMTAVFGTDPINWLKWSVVFGVLILGYIMAFPVYKKVHYAISWDKKRDIAQSRGHTIRATLVSGNVILRDNRKDSRCRGRYTYTIDGRERFYNAIFSNTKHPPRLLDLYYVDKPKKVFSCQEYHWDNHKALILAPVMLSPWILAIITMLALKIEMP